MSNVFTKLADFTLSPSTTFFSLTLTSKTAETVNFDLHFPEASANPMGLVQGGMITAALDDATSVAMIDGYHDEKAPLSTGLHTLFHRPLHLGPAHIVVNIIKLGRRSATSEGRLFNTNRQLVATLLHSAQPVDKS
jgi:acyl-coenzyme A thioesterase PaaI-like protein